MEGTEEHSAATEEPVIPGWIGPDTRSPRRRPKPWYKRRHFRRYAMIALMMIVVIVCALILILSR